VNTTRRNFLSRALQLAGAGLALSIWPTGCGEPPPDEEEVGGNCLEAGTSIDIRANHDHRMLVPKEDIAAGEAKSYSIQGIATHGHRVELSANDFAKLSENITVKVTSSSDGGHDHEVTIHCV